MPSAESETDVMKYVVFLIDGMADYPLPELGGKTPVEAARTPTLDLFAEPRSLARS